MIKAKFTICVECRHLKRGGRGIWYNYTGEAVTKDEAMDPVTGKKCYTAKNSLGEVYFTEDRHPYCRNINTNGSCVLWHKK